MVCIMNNKVVFISHSSKDFDFANKVCDILEESNLPCWIAPRDIPYGESWSEKITQAIFEAKIMLFVFSENSNKSSQVLNEIHLALENGLTIITIRLTDDEYNPSLKYFLSLHQWLRVDQTCIDKQIKELANRINFYIGNSGNDKTIGNNTILKNLDLEIDETVNIDNSFDSRLYRGDLFKPNKPSDKENVKGLKKKLLDRVGEKVLHNMFVENNSNDNQADTTEDLDSYDNSRGLFISIPEQENENTLMFMVRRTINEDNYTQEYIPELLEKETEILPDGNRCCNYYIDELNYEGNPLIIVTIVKDKNVIVTNMGFVDNNTLKILDRPLNTKEIKTSENNKTTIKRYAANEHGHIIIDVDTGNIVDRIKYFDKTSNKWKYYVELCTNKKYYLLNAKCKSRRKAKPFFIAYGYYKGCYGLKQNYIEAAVWFEKAATKESYYYLAEIFKDDPLLSNEEDYKHYSKLYNDAN